MSAYPTIERHYATSVAVYTAVNSGLRERMSPTQIANMVIEILVEESAAYQKVAHRLLANHQVPIIIKPDTQETND